MGTAVPGSGRRQLWRGRPVTVRRGAARKEAGPRRTGYCGYADGQRGAVTAVQVVPSQTSVSGDRAPLAVGLLTPTATQWAAEGQDTDTSALNVTALGVVRGVQVVPFHCSARVVSLVPAWSI